MYYFTSDYTEGCTPEILEALAATNFEQTGGYGIDPYCETAALLIKKECGRSDIDVHFMTGGTQDVYKRQARNSQRVGTLIRCPGHFKAAAGRCPPGPEPAERRF